MPRLLPQRRIAAEVSPDCLGVTGKRTRPPEDHRQPRAHRRTDRQRHPRKTFRCSFQVRGEEGTVVQGRGTDGDLGTVVWPRPDLYFVVEETRASGSDRCNYEAGNRHLRSRHGDLPDGAGVRPTGGRTLPGPGRAAARRRGRERRSGNGRDRSRGPCRRIISWPGR